MGKVTTMIVSPTYGRFIFDAVFSTDHSANATVTQHPVQSGASISDHAYMEPDEVSVEIGMTDTAAIRRRKPFCKRLCSAARHHGAQRAVHADHSPEDLSEHAHYFHQRA